ncbi:hypothetical protein EE612_027633 [Oryza sativa]|nr:hypothetical protein EE612_027633 [Oryza sativa]
MATGQGHRGREGAAAESHGEDLLSVLPDEILLHIRLARWRRGQERRRPGPRGRMARRARRRRQAQEYPY